jgi:hypothetical protein
MILEMDNTGAVDLVNNVIVGARTRHIETRQYYLRELKTKEILVVRWNAGVVILMLIDCCGRHNA